MNASEKILKRILESNKGVKLTVDQIIELSKKEEYHKGHHYYSKHGISEAFVRTRISIFANKFEELYDDFLFPLVKEVEIEDRELILIKT
jgi:hypothetical protein